MISVLGAVAAIGFLVVLVGSGTVALMLLVHWVYDAAYGVGDR